MNKAIFGLIVGGASALAGLVSGYFLCKKVTVNKLEEQYEKALNDEIASIRETRRKMDEIKAKQSSEHEEKTAPYIVQPPVQIANVDRVQTLMNEGYSYRDAFEKARQSREADLAALEYPEEDDEEEDDDRATEEEMEEDLQNVMEYWSERGENGIAVISLEEYRKLPPYFEFKTWHYFDVECVLVDDTEMIVEDVSFTIGDEAVQLLGSDEAANMAEGDRDCVYVVNTNMSLAIEVGLMHKSFVEWSGM